MTPSTGARFRESAVIVLVRGHGAELETYWVRRSDAVAYMPGFEAFVGGTASAEDAELPVEGAVDDRERTLMACAIREAFEETGVLVALAAQPAGDVAESRRRLLAGEAAFPALAREHGWRFVAAELTFAGRWQTPVFAPVRFDTTYFLARVPAGQEPEVHVGELASGEWIRPRAALDRYRGGEVTFAAPILYTLLALAEGEEGLAGRLARGPEWSGIAPVGEGAAPESERATDAPGAGASGSRAIPIHRIEMKWGIVLHPMKTRPLPPATHTNAYLVGEREVALIDPGSGEPAEVEALITMIEALRAEGRRLKLVLLTHHHADHVGGLDAIRARYHVPVAAHSDTGRHVAIDLALKDGDWIPLMPGTGGWNLRAIHTPGHARGHLCFLHPRTRSLFTGDTIPGGRGTVIIDPPEGDMAAYLHSLERLLEEPVETLFPGHGSPQGAGKRRIRGLIEHRLGRERKVLGSLTPEPQPLDGLVPRAYDDTPREMWGYAERSLLAHLLKLEAEGRAAQAEGRWRSTGAPGAAAAGAAGGPPDA
jgi:glyoxylase-like metal-dependent hydrolase (beta-lactamase superfamily II)/8-oxo-dGTP pyrophosphatase MutT (NUDIX family)